MSRTLCTENDFTDTGEDVSLVSTEEEKTILVTVSTSSHYSVNFSLSVSRENNFVLMYVTHLKFHTILVAISGVSNNFFSGL